MGASIQCLEPVAYTFWSEDKTKNPDSTGSNCTFIFQYRPPVAKGTECKIRAIPGQVAIPGFYIF